MLYGVVDAQPSKDLHHVIAIRRAPHLRMEPSNWLAVCSMHHEELERDEIEGMKTKRWSESYYHAAMGGVHHPSGVGKIEVGQG